MQIAGDVMFQAADWPGAVELADRYKKMLPPQLQNPGDPAQLQAKLQQGMQMVNQLTAKVHELQDKLDAGIPEIESRERITAMQEETKRMNISANAIVAEANLGYKAAIDQLQGQIQAIQHSMDHTQQGQSQAFDQLLDHFQNQGLDIDKAASDQNAAAPSEPEAA
jgi:ABC-type phosphate transport system auxiliary subunit